MAVGRFCSPVSFTYMYCFSFMPLFASFFYMYCSFFQNEPFFKIRERIQKRLDVPEKEFEKVGWTDFTTVFGLHAVLYLTEM
jgi:hypothetical protein